MTGPNHRRGFLARLKERKIAQWGVAYLAGGWVALQLVDLLRETFSFSPLVQRVVLVLLGVGFLATLVVAWYHGEKGEQRVPTLEILMLAALVLLAGTGVALVGRGSGLENPIENAGEAEAPGSPTPVQRASVVVLPFENVGGDPENEYFSDGLTDELINALSRVPGLQVAARTSSFAFKEQPAPVDEIAQRLGVAHVLEGSVRMVGNRLRITSNLVRAEDGYQLWSERYDRELVDIFEVQEEISDAIVRSLEVRLGAGDALLAAPSTTDLPAYDLYLRGRHLWKRAGEADIAQSIVLFQQALDRDPGFAAAWVGLADAYQRQANWAHAAPLEVRPLAAEAVRRALELAPEMAEAHASLAHQLRWWDHDRPAARREFETALRLRPDYPEFHQLYAWFLVDEGRFEAAVGQMRHAQELDPLSVPISAQVATMLFYAGRYAEAAAQARQTLEMAPGYHEAVMFLALAQWELGQEEEAIELLEENTGQEPSSWTLSTLGYLYAASDRRDDALRVLEEMEEMSRRSYLPSGTLAAVHVALGEKDRALDLLEDAYEEGSLWPEVNVDPLFASLRTEPRFQALVRKLGLL
jgi:TolB-like protein/Flp pilus assembly protein TadD